MDLGARVDAVELIPDASTDYVVEVVGVVVPDLGQHFLTLSFVGSPCVVIIVAAVVIVAVVVVVVVVAFAIVTVPHHCNRQQGDADDRTQDEYVGGRRTVLLLIYMLQPERAQGVIRLESPSVPAVFCRGQAA